MKRRKKNACKIERLRKEKKSEKDVFREWRITEMNFGEKLDTRPGDLRETKIVRGYWYLNPVQGCYI